MRQTCWSSGRYENSTIFACYEYDQYHNPSSYLLPKLPLADAPNKWLTAGSCRLQLSARFRIVISFSAASSNFSFRLLIAQYLNNAAWLDIDAENYWHHQVISASFSVIHGKPSAGKIKAVWRRLLNGANLQLKLTSPPQHRITSDLLCVSTGVDRCWP